jgi:hypothetical protein
MKRNPFWIGCRWTVFFYLTITIIIIYLLKPLMFKQKAEEKAFTATQNFVANKGGGLVLY